jgi:hypothetical protein
MAYQVAGSALWSWPAFLASLDLGDRVSHGNPKRKRGNSLPVPRLRFGLRSAGEKSGLTPIQAGVCREFTRKSPRE